ncbi:MAG: hypothetical protein BWY93_01834 [Euryarchaeota archaeon ADurb.BinA087]|nr:MAG: hypothetical protein BWY93_01834 [Euryarchaeota archaeon ADurb.BinA087]
MKRFTAEVRMLTPKNILMRFLFRRIVASPITERMTTAI